MSTTETNPNTARLHRIQAAAAAREELEDDHGRFCGCRECETDREV